MKPFFAALAFVAVLGSSPASAQDPPVPDAAASDPVSLGWMQGTPPPADKVVRFDDYSFFTFPKWRWSFSHWRELFPTTNVSRGEGPVARLPVGLRTDIDAVTFTPIGGDRPMTWEASLAANYTDGIVVLHKGRIVYERYFGALEPRREHIAFSVTKSFIGTLAAMLVDEGKLDPARTIASYIPELASSGFADATVRQVLDMTTALKFSEKYGDPNANFMDYVRASRSLPRSANYAGAPDTYAYLAGVAKDGEHGAAFTYRTINTEVLGWLIARVTGKPLADVLSERIWSKLGAEADGYLQVDTIGSPSAGGGFNVRLRDLARFGEMMRLGGRWQGIEVVPAAVVAEIRRGAGKEDFAKAAYPTLPGWSYHNQWWVSHNEHGAYSARGIHGQAIYIDPAAEMVIARFASHPMSANANLDPKSLPAYHALAEHLMGKRR